jgi:aspartyl-tRNA(Asn)/glutamyl-tRNA(Gln) amidotransferase subunit C
MSKLLLSKEQVKKIAKLCNIEIPEKELEKYAKILSETLETIDTLSELDTEGVEETYQVTGLKSVFQEEGDPKTTLSKDKVVKNAKKIVKGLFATKAVFDR